MRFDVLHCSALSINTPDIERKESRPRPKTLLLCKITSKTVRNVRYIFRYLRFCPHWNHFFKNIEAYILLFTEDFEFETIVFARFTQVYIPTGMGIGCGLSSIDASTCTQDNITHSVMKSHMRFKA